VFDSTRKALAPGGVPIYFAEKRENNVSKMTAAGAIAVRFNKKKGRLIVKRPKYLSLIQLTAKISRYSVEIIEVEQ
jgi:hypothetical protein